LIKQRGNSSLPPLEARQIIPFQGLYQSRPLWGRIFTVHLNLAIAYSLSGQEELARAEAAEVLKIYPKFSLENHSRAYSYFKNQDDLERFWEGLRKAGLK
jgi:hypothetical protein